MADQMANDLYRILIHLMANSKRNKTIAKLIGIFQQTNGKCMMS